MDEAKNLFGKLHLLFKEDGDVFSTVSPVDKP